MNDSELDRQIKAEFTEIGHRPLWPRINGRLKPPVLLRALAPLIAALFTLVILHATMPRPPVVSNPKPVPTLQISPMVEVTML